MAEKMVPTVGQSMAKMVEGMHGIVLDERLSRPKIGKVLTPPPSLTVQVDDIVLERGEMYIFSYSLPGYTRHMVGATSYRGGGGGYAEYESHNHPIDNDETWTDTLKPGDLVGVIPLEGVTDSAGDQSQMYLITGRLTRL